MHNSTIKAAIAKEYPDVKFIEIKKHKFGVFSAKVEKQLIKKTKIGLIIGNWNQGDPLIEEIDWV